MSVMISTVLVIAGMAVLGAVIGAVVSAIFGGGRSGMLGLSALLALVGAAGGWWVNGHTIQPGRAYQAAIKAADAAPDVAALKRYYPNDYANMQRQLELAKDDRSGAAGARYLIRLHVREVMTKRIKQGADKQLVALMTQQRDEAGALAARSPGYCMEYFNGGRLSFDPGAVLSADLLRRDATVAADLLTQTATNPAKNAAGAEALNIGYASRLQLYREGNARQAVSDKAMGQFSQDDQETIKLMVRRKTNLSDQPALAAMLCKYKIGLLGETLKLPEQQAAMVYRMSQGVLF